MVPPQPNSPASTPHSRSIRRGLQEGGGRRGPTVPQRSSSFQGRSTNTMMSHSSSSSSDLNNNIMRRPKTQPDLLAGPGAVRRSKPTPSSSQPSNDQTVFKIKLEPQQNATRPWRSLVPAKILVNVNIQRSLGAVQVMASTEWSVEDLTAASLKQYVKEFRRPLLPSNNPSEFGLHYSQFSLDSLDPKEKLVGLGSRNFFLCPKIAASISVSKAAINNESPPTSSTNHASHRPVSLAAGPSLSSPPPSSSSSSSCSYEVDEASKIPFISWLRFKQLLF